MYWNVPEYKVLERRRLRADLILDFKIFKGEIDLNPSNFFLRPPRAGLRGHTYRLLQGPSGAFSVRVVKYLKRLPTPLVLSPSLSIFKKQLDRQCSEIFSVRLHRHFSQYCSPRLFMLPYSQILICSCGYYGPSWPILLTINKINKSQTDILQKFHHRFQANNEGALTFPESEETHTVGMVLLSIDETGR